MRWLGGKVAAVTGGFSGNGEAAVRLLAEEGGRVAIGDVNVSRGGGVAEEIRAVAPRLRSISPPRRRCTARWA
jgi:NAD(P)-dependent dehydrogenase (short-subunit alcohol dehydrogenase family)